MENFATTVTAVGSILTTVVVGAVCIPYVPSRSNTLKDLGLVTSTIFIPCMLFNHLVTAFTPEAMMTSFILPLATIFGCVVGFIVGSIFCRFFLDESTKQYKALALMFCTFQNAVVLPLSLIMSVYRAARLHWLDDALYEKCVAYVFIYTIPIIIFIWSVGNLITKAGAAELRALEEEELRRQEQAGIDGTEDKVVPVSPAGGKQEDNSNNNKTDSNNNNKNISSTLQTVRIFFKNILQSMWNAPFISTLFGLAIGLNPWMASGFQSHFAVVWDAVKILGEGTVPCVLVMLGGNLGSTALPKEGGQKAPPAAPSKKGGTETPIGMDAGTDGTMNRVTSSISLDENRDETTGGDDSSKAKADEKSRAADVEQQVSVLSGNLVGLVAKGRRSSVVAGGGSQDVTPTLGASSVNEDCELSSFASSANISLTTLPAVSSRRGGDGAAASTSEGEVVGRETQTDEKKLAGGLEKRGETDLLSSPSPQSGLIFSIFAAVLKHLRILFDPNGIPLKVLIIIPLVRLIIVPICAISMFHFVLKPAGILPPVEEDRAMWLVLITEATSPSAININVLCTVHGYMPGTASKMIFYQYSMCVVTMVLWLMFTLWYVSPHEGL